MIEKAKEFAATKLFSSRSEFYFYTSWDLVPNLKMAEITQDNSFVIFNASYLFASSSLNENDLAQFVNKVSENLKASAYFVFQNPDRVDRSEKYKRFKQQVSQNVVSSNTQQIYYKNKGNSTFEPSNEVVNFEILSL